MQRCTKAQDKSGDHVPAPKHVWDLIFIVLLLYSLLD